MGSQPDLTKLVFSLGTRRSWRVVSREDKALVDSSQWVKFRAMWTLLLSYRTMERERERKGGWKKKERKRTRSKTKENRNLISLCFLFFTLLLRHLRFRVHPLSRSTMEKSAFGKLEFASKSFLAPSLLDDVIKLQLAPSFLERLDRCFDEIFFFFDELNFN